MTQRIYDPCPICQTHPIPHGGCIHYGPELLALWDAQTAAKESEHVHR